MPDRSAAAPDAGPAATDADGTPCRAVGKAPRVSETPTTRPANPQGIAPIGRCLLARRGGAATAGVACGMMFAIGASSVVLRPSLAASRRPRERRGRAGSRPGSAMLGGARTGGRGASCPGPDRRPPIRLAADDRRRGPERCFEKGICRAADDPPGRSEDRASGAGRSPAIAAGLPVPVKIRSTDPRGRATGSRINTGQRMTIGGVDDRPAWRSRPGGGPPQSEGREAGMRREIGPLRALANGLLCLGILGPRRLRRLAGRRQELAGPGDLSPPGRVRRRRRPGAGGPGLRAGGRRRGRRGDRAAGGAGLAGPAGAAGRRPAPAADPDRRRGQDRHPGGRRRQGRGDDARQPRRARSCPTAASSRSAPPVELADLMREATEAMDRVDAVADSAERGLGEVTPSPRRSAGGEGTIGRLVMDDEPIDKLVRLASRGRATLTDLQDNLDAIKNTWPFSRYFERRGYDDRDLVLYRPERLAIEPGRRRVRPLRARPRRADRGRPGGPRRGRPLVAASMSTARPRSSSPPSPTPGSTTTWPSVLTQQQAEAVRQLPVDAHNLETAGWFRSRTVAAVGFGTHRPRIPPRRAPGRPPRPPGRDHPVHAPGVRERRAA